MNYNDDGSKYYDKDTAQKIRDRLAEVLEDPDKPKIELDVLNSLLQQAATLFRRSLQDNLTNLFNQVALRSTVPRFDFGDDSQLREENKDIITSLTKGRIKTAFSAKIDIDPTYTGYSAGDIRELDGYKELHNIAQRADVAINVRGLTAGEVDFPIVVFDATKSYAEGESDSKYGYPDLSPPPIVETPKSERATFSVQLARRFPM